MLNRIRPVTVVNRYPWTFRGQIIVSLSHCINNLLHFTNRHLFLFLFQSFYLKIVRSFEKSKKKVYKTKAKRKQLKYFIRKKGFNLRKKQKKKQLRVQTNISKDKKWVWEVRPLQAAIVLCVPRIIEPDRDRRNNTG